jgi:ABC-2 type transport system ATP-binding protein
VTTEPDGSLDVIGLTTEEIAARASAASIPVHELSSNQASLEEAFMELTRDAVEYTGETATTPHPTDDKAA